MLEALPRNTFANFLANILVERDGIRTRGIIPPAKYRDEAVEIYERIRQSKPNLTVGTEDDPYLHRWFIERKHSGPVENIFLHKFMRSDDDRALHDHPWNSKSIILWRGYIEHLPGNVQIRRRTGDVWTRQADQPHRIELLTDKRTGKPLPAYTLFITGPKVREWGFHCPQGWVHNKQFLDKKNEGLIGRGCGE